MRSPQEVSNGQNVALFNSAKKFYDSLSKRVIAKQIIIDLFAFTLNEMGLAEMIELLNNSGGFIVMHE
jgi:protein transport protein SEC23